MTWLLLSLYLLGAVLEILGIWYAARVGLKVIESDGVARPGIWYPERRQVRLALVLVLAAVVVGRAGNPLSLVR